MTADPGTPAPEHLPFRVALAYWLKLGFISFGGPAGQIAIMHEELVERRRWISERRFLHALNYCMVLPGPEAQQLATYVGWLLHRTLGGIAAGLLFVLPGALVVLALTWVATRNLPGLLAKKIERNRGIPQVERIRHRQHPQQADSGWQLRSEFLGFPQR